MNKPLVSIIVPCYNSAQYLEETIRSVLAQTYEEWECIIVNDGSTDSSLEVAEKLCLKDCRVVLYSKVNGGMSSARNYGIIHSKGEYILPLDSDDLIAPTFIEKTIDCLQNNPDVKLVYTKAERFDQLTGEWLLPEYSFDKILWSNMICITSLFRRSDFVRVGGFKENMRYGYEDWEFWLSLLSADDRVVQLPEVLFYYRAKTTGSVLNNVMSNHQREAMIQLVENHLDLYRPFFNQIVWLKNVEERSKEKDEEIRDLRNQLNQAYSSKSYRFGRALANPFNWFIDKLKK